jgi:hypothetical protein
MMGYYGRNRANFGHNPVSKTELVERIEKVAARGTTTLTDWERSFLGSLRDSAKKWGRLTGKQHDVFQRIERKSNPKHIAARKKWDESFTPAMRESLKFAAEYYKANPPYFSDAAERILSNDEYVPTEKLYRKMVENKYVQRALSNASEEIKYPAGSMVMVRDSQTVVGMLATWRGKLAMVVECEQDVRSATKGARSLTVLPVGSTHTIKTHERFIKKAKV